MCTIKLINSTSDDDLKGESIQIKNNDNRHINLISTSARSVKVSAKKKNLRKFA